MKHVIILSITIFGSMQLMDASGSREKKKPRIDSIPAPIKKEVVSTATDEEFLEGVQVEFEIFSPAFPGSGADGAIFVSTNRLSLKAALGENLIKKNRDGSVRILTSVILRDGNTVKAFPGAIEPIGDDLFFLNYDMTKHGAQKLCAQKNSDGNMDIFLR